MTFTTIALIAAIATLGLGVGFLFSSTSMLKQWGMQAPNEAKVMSRRNGAIYLGISTILFLARTSMPTTEAIAIGAVSYTHLDVYKRQHYKSASIIALFDRRNYF